MINPFIYKIKPQISIITSVEYPNKIVTEKIYCRRNKKNNRYLHKVYVNNKFICNFLGYWCSNVHITETGSIRFEANER